MRDRSAWAPAADRVTSDDITGHDNRPLFYATGSMLFAHDGERLYVRFAFGHVRRRS